MVGKRGNQSQLCCKEWPAVWFDRIEAMHESGLVEELIEEIGRVARDNGGARVSRVEIGVGELAGFTHEHFEEHFRAASRNTLADGAVLEIHTREGDALTLEGLDIEDE